MQVCPFYQRIVHRDGSGTKMGLQNHGRTILEAPTGSGDVDGWCDQCWMFVESATTHQDVIVLDQRERSQSVASAGKEHGINVIDYGTQGSNNDRSWPETPPEQPEWLRLIQSRNIEEPRQSHSSRRVTPRPQHSLSHSVNVTPPIPLAQVTLESRRGSRHQRQDISIDTSIQYNYDYRGQGPPPPRKSFSVWQFLKELLGCPWELR